MHTDALPVPKRTDPTDATLPKDDVYALLSNARRRAAFDAIHFGAPIAKEALIDAVATAEYGDPTDKERKRIHVSLHQCHLPKLEDAGVVEQTAEGYRLGENAGEFRKHRHRPGVLSRLTRWFR